VEEAAEGCGDCQFDKAAFRSPIAGGGAAFTYQRAAITGAATAPSCFFFMPAGWALAAARCGGARIGGAKRGQAPRSAAAAPRYQRNSRQPHSLSVKIWEDIILPGKLGAGAEGIVWRAYTWRLRVDICGGGGAPRRHMVPGAMVLAAAVCAAIPGYAARLRCAGIAARAAVPYSKAAGRCYCDPLRPGCAMGRALHYHASAEDGSATLQK